MILQRGEEQTKAFGVDVVMQLGRKETTAGQMKMAIWHDKPLNQRRSEEGASMVLAA